MRPEALLSLLQVSDTAFPTGAFAHSMGLEAFYDAGELRDAGDLRSFVELTLNSLATSDCVALRSAYAADSVEELTWIDWLLAATKLTRELREASAATGRRFLASVGALGVEDDLLDGFAASVRDGASPGNLATGFGVVGPALDVELPDALHAYLYSTAASLVAAGQKLIPLGGSAAQRVLYELHGKIAEAVEESETLRPDEMYAFAPTIDVRSMLHERQRVRLYIS
ncbi:MAG: urease accessory protein UreF [Rubrobacteraceae bacterium]